MTSRTYLESVWLDYFNNYLTPEKYADHHHITAEQAAELLKLARNVYETANPHA
jgi:hypothetical protein